MHQVIREHLEELLAGTSQAGSVAQLHLEACAECREELAAFRAQAGLLRVLRCTEDIGPAPSFYARVWERIEERRKASVWSALLDPAFALRLAAGSLAALLLIGGFVIMNEAAPPEPAVTVMAVEDHPPGLGMDPGRDRDTVLVTLATYRE
ncbi:MAG: hypothetical protein ACP5U2_15395 [Bryobacteraceae bacterium]